MRDPEQLLYSRNHLWVEQDDENNVFIGLTDEIDGMIHLSDISWEKSGDEAVKDYTKGQEIEAKIIDVDVEKERISLGIKQLSLEDSLSRRSRPTPRHPSSNPHRSTTTPPGSCSIRWRACWTCTRG